VHIPGVVLTCHVLRATAGTFSSSSSFSSAKGFAFLIVSTLLTVCSICLYGHEKHHEAQRCQSNRDEAQHIFHISSNDFPLGSICMIGLTKSCDLNHFRPPLRWVGGARSQNESTAALSQEMAF
jgi:hypothetical protein